MSLPYVVQCATCLGCNPVQATPALAQWATFSGPCACEVPATTEEITMQATERVATGTCTCGATVVGSSTITATTGEVMARCVCGTWVDVN